MKIRFLLLFLVSGVISGTTGQNTIELTFTAVDSSAYVRLDSIKVINRTQGTDTLINWPDTTLTLSIIPGDKLLYIGYSTRNPFSIPNLNSSMDNFNLFQNYPNPVSEQSSISLYLPEKGELSVIIMDLSGQKTICSELLLGRGYHFFKFTAGDENLYFFIARWNGLNRSIKIISTASDNNKRCTLDYTGSNNVKLPLQVSALKAGLIKQESGILANPDTSKTYTFQFASSIPCPGTPTITYGGQVYNTIQIFSQCWLKENLNAGTMLSGSQDQTNNGIIEKYCYNNQPDSCTKYGGLYQWDEMMQYTNIQGVRGICPLRWHLPADEEWKILEGAVDSHFGIGDRIWDYDIMNRGYDAGSNLKATIGWKYEGNGSDLFGFSGLPGGIRFDGGLFYSVGECGGWWTSSEYSPGCLPWYRGLNFGYTDPTRSRDSNKSRGFSIRCIMDQ
jgi:uncharacterized protein (TIGR02145 family)